MGRLPPLRADVCFILFTTQVDDALVRAAADLNANGFVLKPTAPEQIRKAILRGRTKAFAPDQAKYRLIDTSVAGCGFGIHAVN